MVVVLVAVGGEDKHKVPLKNKYVAVIKYILCFCVTISREVL